MLFNKTTTDYSFYLVTNADLVPATILFLDQVRDAIANGVTVLQLREKELSTGAFIERAHAVHELTRAAGIPLIINDRVDVALAVDAEGVHVGQDDMLAATVRTLLGPEKIVGVSCESPQEARVAIAQGADYIGIGPVYDTTTKKLTKMPIGPSGAREVMRCLRDERGEHVKAVVIGGINHENAKRVLLASGVEGKAVDGAAVVSCILATTLCAKAAHDFKCRLEETALEWNQQASQASPFSHSPLGTGAGPCMISAVVERSPMVHHITNGVAKSLQANVALAVGASPIMSECEAEFDALSRVPHAALVLNTGTITVESTALYKAAITSYNRSGAPIVYDPVGAGATAIRQSTFRELLDTGSFTVIKGNVGEIIAAVGGQEGEVGDEGPITMRGVDNVSVLEVDQVVAMAQTVARANRTIVVVTGVEDVVTDGLSGRTVVVSGGHPLMGRITASGCSLGTVIAAFVGANPSRAFEATVKAVEVYNSSGNTAGKRVQAREEGPGSFVVAFIDALYRNTYLTVRLEGEGHDSATREV